MIEKRQESRGKTTKNTAKPDKKDKSGVEKVKYGR